MCNNYCHVFLSLPSDYPTAHFFLLYSPCNEEVYNNERGNNHNYHNYYERDEREVFLIMRERGLQ